MAQNRGGAHPRHMRCLADFIPCLQSDCLGVFRDGLPWLVQHWGEAHHGRDQHPQADRRDQRVTPLHPAVPR